MEDLKRIRTGFVQKIGLPALKGLLDDLWQCKVLSTEDKDTVTEDHKSRADRARCLIDMVMAKGVRASQAMIDSMKKRDKHLCITLGLISSDRVENESHMHAVSSSETNTPESAPQLPQATEEEEEDTPYPMKAQPKGYCLIVNNFDFSRSGRNLGQRMGTDIDEKSLRSVFSWLGFQVEVVQDATGDQMLSTMRGLASKDHSGMDCVACIVLSHGLEGGVYGVDGKVVRLKELADFLNGVRCASLRGKPKLFFIQACQGNKREQAVPVLDNRPARPEVSDQTDTQTDGPSSTGDPCSDGMEASVLIPTSADFLTAMATTPSYTSMRVEDRGSWFIQSLCQNLVKLVPRGKDLAWILTTVHNDVGNKSNRIGGRRQMPQHHTSLRTRLVFPVPEAPIPSLPTSP
ncbi:caspase-8-like [Gadus macrocephalus]|uniref:caspase-8-like n=1 Tax=Gadus macrocephalus TaxID=80720 RepID=UPI0028CBA0F3|nr:caspase-8-like [Gadus macrocephalus]